MIGKHLLCLNVFREPDGSVQITTSGHSRLFMAEYNEWSLKHPKPQIPNDYAATLIIEAAERIKKRRKGR